jgi:hypothetical protein
MKRRHNALIALALAGLLVPMCAFAGGTPKTAKGEVKAPESTTRTIYTETAEAEVVLLDCSYEARKYPWTERDVELIAKTLYGETRCDDIPTDQKAAVAWCILNRVDAGWGTIEEVITANLQFTGYRASNPVWDSLYERTLDVLNRWQAEHDGVEDVGRTLPADYLYFTGDGERNNFKKEWKSGEIPWDWSLESPYKN